MAHRKGPAPCFFCRRNTRTLLYLVAAWLLVVAALAVYWAVLFDSHALQRRAAADQARLRGAQIAQALALQVDALVGNIDYMARNLVDAWTSTTPGHFREVVATASAALPAGALAQVGVIDRDGKMVYSSLDDAKGAAAAPLSVADREYFRAHFDGRPPGLFISHPVRGRLSQQWRVPFSRAIVVDGRAEAVLVVSISPEYLSRSLHDIFPDINDVAMLLREDGSYLARSHDLDAVLGRAVPAERPFLVDQTHRSGRYEIVSPIDGIARSYAWHRAAGYPLLVSVGMDTARAIAPVEAAIGDSVRRNLIGTLLLVLAAASINWLFVQKLRHAERLAKLVAEVPGVLYQYMQRPDGTACFPYASPGVADIYGVTPAEVARSADKVFAILHPDDLARVSESIRQSAEHLTTWRCEYRVRFADGTERWLLGQAKPERSGDGGTLWHGYIHDVTATHAASEALQRSEERLRLTVAAVRDGLWEWDMRSGELHWDARCHEMLGMAPGTFPGRFDAWADLLDPSDRERTLVSLHAQIDKQRSGDSVASDEFRMRTAGGGWLWVEGRGRVVAWENGEPLRMIGTYTDISQRVADAQMRRALLDQGAAAIFVASRDRHAIYANARARELFGQPGEDMVGFDFRRLHVSEEAYEAFGEQYGQLHRDGSLRREFPVIDAHGRNHWFDASGTLLDPEQPDGPVIWMLIDITERYLAEAALSTERLRLTTLLERFPGGVLVEDANNRIVMANENLCQLLGLSCGASALPGMSQEALRRAGAEAGLAWLQNPGARPQSEQRRTIEVTGADGRNLEVDWVPILRGEDDLGHLWLVRDITERKQREAMLATLASTDALTGLPNRRAFMASLEQAMAEPAPRGALLMLDIDHFKRINDTHGHPVGDRVLQHVAEIIRHGLRRNDVAGRLGGEEFAVLLSGTALEDGRRLAERLREAFCAAPARTEAGVVPVTVSIGVAALAASPTASAALVRADTALYEAKGAGRNRVSVAAA